MADDRDDAPEDDLPEGGARTTAWGTTAVVCFCLAVGVVMAWTGVPVLFAPSGALISFGALDPVRVWHGEVWRLFSACFVHVGAWHLGLNLWVLWQVGRVYERLVGTAHFALVYVVSGIFGFALSTALLPGVTAGASGAIFGITGALLAVAAVARHKHLGRFLLTSLVPFVAATFALGFLMPMVNNVAHFGGLVMGAALGYGLAATDERLGALTDGGTVSHDIAPRRRLLGNIALVSSVLVFALVGAAAGAPRFSPRFHVTMGLRALHDVSLKVPRAVAAPTTPGKSVDSPRQAEARAHLENARRLAPNDTATLILEARAKEVMGDADGARATAAEAFRRALRSDRTTTFDTIAAELGLLEPDAEMPFVDGFTTRLLCDAALSSPSAPDADPSTQSAKAPLLKNSCAWLFARARETAVRDPARAVTLAAEAHAEAGDSAAITHTYAVALADSGNVEQGLALLEKLEVTGKTGELGVAFVRAERARLAAQARSSSAPPSAGAGP